MAPLDLTQEPSYLTWMSGVRDEIQACELSTELGPRHALARVTVLRMNVGRHNFHLCVRQQGPHFVVGVVGRARCHVERIQLQL